MMARAPSGAACGAPTFAFEPNPNPFFSNFGVSNLDVFYFFYFVFFNLLLNKVCLNLVDLHFGANKLYSFLPPVEITLFPLVLIESPSNGPPFFGR